MGGGSQGTPPKCNSLEKLPSEYIHTHTGVCVQITAAQTGGHGFDSVAALGFSFLLA